MCNPVYKEESKILMAQKHVEFAHLMERCHKYDKAEKHYIKALQLSSHCVPILYMYGCFLHSKTNRINDAQDLFIKVIYSSTFCQLLMPSLDIDQSQSFVSFLPNTLLLDNDSSTEMIISRIYQFTNKLSESKTTPVCPRRLTCHCCCAYCIGPLVRLALIQLFMNELPGNVLHRVPIGQDIVKNNGSARITGQHSTDLAVNLLLNLEAKGYIAPDVVMNLTLGLRMTDRYKPMNQQSGRDKSRQLVLEYLTKKNWPFCKVHFPITNLGPSVLPDTSPLHHFDLTTLTICCVKWGDLYSAEYVNHLFEAVLKFTHFSCCRYYNNQSNHVTNLSVKTNTTLQQLNGSFKRQQICDCSNHFRFICFTDNSTGLLSHSSFIIELFSNNLPSMNTTNILFGWWCKAFLFSSHATHVMFKESSSYIKPLVLYLDLDVVVTGNVMLMIYEYVSYVISNNTHKKQYSSIMATLSTNHIFCELIPKGINSSLMLWSKPYINAEQTILPSDHFQNLLQQVIQYNQEIVSGTIDSFNSIQHHCLSLQQHQQCLPTLTELSMNLIYLGLTSDVQMYIHRFDYWLEFIFSIKSSSIGFLDSAFESNQRIMDYNTLYHPTMSQSSVEINDLPYSTIIVIFPRSPKPHQVWKKHPKWMVPFVSTV